MSAAGAHALAPVTVEPYALNNARPQLGRMQFQRLTEMCSDLSNHVVNGSFRCFG